MKAQFMVARSSLIAMTTEGFNKSQVRPIIEKLMKEGVPELLTMSSAEAFNKALIKANLKPEKEKAALGDSGTKSSDTVDKASEKLKAQKMFGANNNEKS